MTLQYVKVQLGGKGRTYTYHNDQPATVRPGDMVEVTTPTGATLECEVLEVDDQPPQFNTKPCYKIG